MEGRKRWKVCKGEWSGVQGVEGCGRVWKGVEGCGRVWKGVEGCGRVWKGHHSE
jgi:hypothetical protein